jgi:anti-sigma-K factor RskA
VELNEMISSGLLELYVLGQTSAEETLLVQSMAAKHPQIVDEIVAIEIAMEGYAQAHAIPPSTHVKEKLFAQLNNTLSSSANETKIVSLTDTPKKSSMGYWKMAAAAAVLLFVGSTIFNTIIYTKYNTVSNDLANVQQQLKQANSDNEEMAYNLKVVQNKNTNIVKLAGLPAAPDAVAKIFWIKDTKEVYVDPSNLPSAPEGKQYQLWAIVDGKPVDAGMIDSKKKTSIQKMKSFGKAEAFAVTLETTGGNPTPKGTMYVLGNL